MGSNVFWMSTTRWRVVPEVCALGFAWGLFLLTCQDAVASPAWRWQWGAAPTRCCWQGWAGSFISGAVLPALLPAVVMAPTLTLRPEFVQRKRFSLTYPTHFAAVRPGWDSSCFLPNPLFLLAMVRGLLLRLGTRPKCRSCSKAIRGFVAAWPVNDLLTCMHHTLAAGSLAHGIWSIFSRGCCALNGDRTSQHFAVRQCNLMVRFCTIHVPLPRHGYTG